jgi:hypothetical protein
MNSLFLATRSSKGVARQIYRAKNAASHLVCIA